MKPKPKITRLAGKSSTQNEPSQDSKSGFSKIATKRSIIRSLIWLAITGLGLVLFFVYLGFADRKTATQNSSQAKNDPAETSKSVTDSNDRSSTNTPVAPASTPVAPASTPVAPASTPVAPASTPVTPASTPSALSQPNNNQWYEGGTLHSANALEWQAATYENKLATCADVIASLWSKKLLSNEIANSITSMDSMRPLAEELVRELDDATKPHPDPETNRQIYVNQKVSSFASMIIIMKGWNK